MNFKFNYTIQSSAGLHARPASRLTNICAKYLGNIFIYHKDNKANAKSIMNLMALGIKEGETVQFSLVDGFNESSAKKIEEEIIEEKI